MKEDDISILVNYRMEQARIDAEDGHTPPTVVISRH
jgi:hypothetical protein